MFPKGGTSHGPGGTPRGDPTLDLHLGVEAYPATAAAFASRSLPDAKGMLPDGPQPWRHLQVDPAGPRPHSISPEELAELEEWRALAAAGDGGALIHLIGIGHVADAGRHVVEILTLEIRERFALLTWKVRRKLDDAGLLMDRPIVNVTDDRATSYRVVPSHSSSGDGGAEGGLKLFPAPPPEANVLRIRIESFDEDDWSRYPEAAKGLGITRGESIGPMDPVVVEVQLHQS